jgi:hypothetical protein
VSPELARRLPAQLSLPFRLRDRSGVLRVEISANDDPRETGHGLVAPGYDLNLFMGFPVMTASVEYTGAGVRAWMGWVQVIERHDDVGGVIAELDRPPIFEGSPLYAFGYLPILADAPANPDHPDGDWVADSFLVAIPDVVRSRQLFPVAGFEWGYRLVRGRPQALFQPAAIGFERWERHRPLLAVECPDWTFLPADATT